MKKIIPLFVFTCLIQLAWSQQKTLSVDNYITNESDREWIYFKSESKIKTDDFFNTFSPYLGISAHDQFVLVKENKSIGLTHTWYQQYHNNIKVVGGEYILHSRNGYLETANGNVVSNININTTPSLSSIDAISILQKIITLPLGKDDADFVKGWSIDLGKAEEQLQLNPELILMYDKYNKRPKASDYRLCYKMNVVYTQTIASEFIYIDANSGEVFKRQPMAVNCTIGSGQTTWNGVKNINTKLVGSSYILNENWCTNPGNVYTKKYSSWGIGTDYTDADNNWNNPSAVTSHWYGRQCLNYFYSTFNRNSFDGSGGGFIILNETNGLYQGCSLDNNAFFDSNNDIMYLGRGNNTTSPNDDLNTLDIVAHELTHGITANTSGLNYQYESGALNESFSDIFGTAVERYVYGTNSFDWTIGEDLSTGVIRSLQNPWSEGKHFNSNSCSCNSCGGGCSTSVGQPSTYYTDPYWYTGSCDNGGVHINSGVQNYWFYLLVNGGSGTNANGFQYNVTGIGFATAISIVYTELTAGYLASTSDYNTAWTATKLIAGTTYGYTSSQYNAVVAAWCAVGIGNTCSSNPCTAPSNDNCSPSVPTITSNGACISGAPYATVACATGSYGANQCTGCSCTSPDDKDVYFKFTAAATSHTVALSNYASNFDGVIELRTACASGTAISCYDPSGTPTSISNTWNNLTIGQTYYIRVFEYNYTGTPPSSPTFTLCLTHTGCTPPTASISPSTATICSGNSIQLTASGGTSYSWSNGSSNATITVSPTSNTTYTVTVTNSGGCTATASRTVNVNSSPNASISPSSASICTGGSIQLTASGGTSYSWSNGSTSSAITVSPTSNTTYTVTVTNSNGCSATANRLVSVSSAPTASISPATATICSGNSIQLTASGGSSYSWSNGATTATITVSPNSNTTYTVTVSNSGCSATATASRTVNVNSSPSASISPSSASICTGGSIQLTASGGTSYSWSNGSTSSAITVSPTSNTTYTVTVTNSNGCSATANRLVSVSSTPTASISPSTATLCSGNSIQLTASGGSSYSWSNGATTASITVSPNSNTTYTVTVSNSGCTATASRLVNVNTTPTASISPSTASICSGGSIALTASGGGTYSWNTGATTATINVSPASSTTYTVTVTSNSCTATSSRLVNVSNQLSASINPANPEFCANGSVTLNATQGAAYTWSGPGGFSGNTQSVTATQAGSYSVNVTNPGGCIGTAPASVTVVQNPTLIVDAGSTQTIQSGDSAVLGGSPTANSGTPPYTYVWNPSSSLNNATIANPTATPTSNTTYSLTVTDSKGCSATDNVQVNVSSGCQSYTLDSDTLYIPSVAANYTVNLTTGAGCPWTIAEGCSWLDFANPSGNGSQTLSFNVTQNAQSTDRTCLVNIQGNLLVVIQALGCVAPVSDFSAPQQAGFAPFTVTFTDNSTNTPTQWLWTFPGGSPATSTAQNPTVTYANGGLFDVTLNATNGCGNNTVTKTNYINVIGTVGIDNLATSENINIYPNPNNGTFRVSAEINTSNTVELKLFSAIGQLIYSSKIQPIANKIDKEISLGNSAAGVYIIQLLVDKKPYYKKLIIE